MKLVATALFLVSIAALSLHCGPSNHDCNVSTFVPYCDSSGALVSCVDEAPGDCAAKEGCDTHVVTTFCGSATEAQTCVTTSAGAMCESVVNDSDAGRDADVRADADATGDASASVDGDASEDSGGD